MHPLVAERRARVLRGHWHRFPVNPARFDVRFERGTRKERLALALIEEARWHKAAAVAEGLPPPARLAWHRASLTMVADLMDRLRPGDYRYGPWYFADEVFQHYFAVPWLETGIDAEVYIRDAIELAVWHLDVGTFALYEGTPKDLGPVVESLLTEMLADVRRHGLDEQEVALLDQWANFAAAHGRHQDLVPLAYAVGSRRAYITDFLADIANLADPDLPLQVYAAANRPGPEQDRIASVCVSLFGDEPPPFCGPIRVI